MDAIKDEELLLLNKKPKGWSTLSVRAKRNQIYCTVVENHQQNPNSNKNAKFNVLGDLPFDYQRENQQSNIGHW